MTLKGMMGAMAFAHLAGLGRARSKAKSEDDEDHRPEDAEDGGQEDPDHEDGGARKSKKAKRAEDDAPDGDDDEAEGDDDDEAAEGDDDDETAEGDDPDDEDAPSSRKAKKAKRAEDEDDGKPQGSFRRGRKAERARWAKVMGSKVSARNLPMACNMLARTGMSASAIIGVLHDTPAAASFSDRSSRNPALGIGGDRPSGSTATASRWDAVMQRVRTK
ncbi:hypothetical protein [Telmatospirillum sp.]|uniref:hypothetical protein n=1 Tax=Telmatospirillum sp. TaxID=2079197 RepID=UPI00283BC277|nr:hypothetical protein [Telmatospirillum sp.]MDR3438958.1 hypothetical protein [Telmatospirillum sp.]